ATKTPYRAVNITTHEYPGFPTDLQAPMTVFLTQAEGESKVFETIFEGRLNYTEALIAMGANITMMDPHRALVRGGEMLRGRRLESPDLRAGLAFIIAAVVAKGESVIHNVDKTVDRGYERVEERLRGIGVDIERVKNGVKA
ncbi:MAG: UDP-N-acetylglucosamine 1-carboxyvinyltransferase, partial [Parcubacteria group bacterium GW2011_GWA1_47_8]